MTIKELKKELKNKKNIVEVLEIKRYLPFVEKQLLCQTVIDKCMDTDEKGLVTCDYFMKQISLDINILTSYTNLTFNEESLLDDYDYLVKDKVWNIILANIDPGEIEFINTMINKEIQQRLEIENGLSNVVATALNRFVDVVDKNTNPKELRKLSKSILKDLNNLNLDNLPQIKEVFSTVFGNQESMK